MMISQKVRIDFFEGEARKILRTELLKISSFLEMKSHADRTLWQSLNYLPYSLITVTAILFKRMIWK